MKMGENVVVSVIIPTHNSGKTITTCLGSIRKQSYPNVEVIVVDENSTDGTRKIAKEFTNNVYSGGYERSAKRNFGAAKASGDYLFFVDSDMELTSKVVEDCVNKALKNKVDAIIIPEVSVGEGFWANCKAFERSFYLGDDTIEAARFFSKDLFYKLKGYDEDMVGAEDWDMHARAREIGASIGRVPSHIIHHEGRLSLSRTARKKRAYSQVFGRYQRRHPTLAKQQFTMFRHAYRRNWRRMLAHPIMTAGFVFMKICEGMAAKAGMVLQKQEVAK